MSEVYNALPTVLLPVMVSTMLLFSIKAKWVTIVYIQFNFLVAIIALGRLSILIK